MINFRRDKIHKRPQLTIEDLVKIYKWLTWTNNSSGGGITHELVSIEPFPVPTDAGAIFTLKHDYRSIDEPPTA